MTYQNQIILEGARVIRHHLPELLGEEAEAFDDRLSELLNSGRDEEEAARQALALLSTSEATAGWMADFLAGRVPPEQIAYGLELRSYSPAPGQHSPPPADRYVCPRGDFVWYRPAVGTPVPRCRTHPDMPLLKAD